MSVLEPDALLDAPEATTGRIARNAAARLAGEIIAKLATLAFFVVTARAVGSSEFGEFTFSLSLASLLVIGAGFGSEDLMSREIAKDRSHLDAVFDAVVSMKVATSVAILGVAAAVLWVSGETGEPLLVFVLVAAGTALDNLQRTWHSVFEAYERMQLTSYSIIVQRIATAGGAIVALALGGNVVAVSAVYVAGSALGVVMAEVLLRRRVGRPRMRIGAGRWWGLIREAAPVGAVAVAGTLLLRLDTTLLGVFSGSNHSAVGVYGAAFRLLEATMFLSWSFGSAILPWFARAGDDAAAGRLRAFELAMKVVCGALLPIGLTFTLFAEPLITTLYGHGYAGAVVPLRWLGAATFFLGFHYLASRVLIARARPALFLKGLAVATVAAIVLDVVLIPAYGADGAAAASALTNLVLSATALWQVMGLLGRVRIVRTFAGPAIAGGAMAACALSLDLPAIPGGALALAAYGLALAGFERVAHRSDFDVLTAAVGGRRMLGRLRA